MMPEFDLAPSETVERSLHPNVRTVWRIGSAGNALFLTFLFLFADLFWLRPAPWWPLPFPVATLVFWVVSTGGLVWIAGLQFDRWRYSLRDEDVLVRFGVLWRTRRSVPRLRVQHVDISSGPVDRWFGLVQLGLYTAGSMGAAATIPGLTPEEAETLREALLATEAPSA
jgi:uncharacterized protein